MDWLIKQFVIVSGIPFHNWMPLALAVIPLGVLLAWSMSEPDSGHAPAARKRPLRVMYYAYITFAFIGVTAIVFVSLVAAQRVIG
jgi:hypothetical protein